MAPGENHYRHGKNLAFFRPTPSWLPPGRLTRYMTLQKQ